MHKRKKLRSYSVQSMCICPTTLYIHTSMMYQQYTFGKGLEIEYPLYASTKAESSEPPHTGAF